MNHFDANKAAQQVGQIQMDAQTLRRRSAERTDAVLADAPFSQILDAQVTRLRDSRNSVESAVKRLVTVIDRVFGEVPETASGEGQPAPVASLDRLTAEQGALEESLSRLHNLIGRFEML